ncbi:ABC transporter ATP-binding protein [Streptococcus dysgalactiae]|uniref:ABC transporter ATP-binding protein n=1 Tax=Streptococcus dysgalactiae TaxID=1334 RepID=UPI000A8B930F|nr:ATP-binding cassette domain-containing protein [Streptococcus dysgalactiae]BCK48256.1 multidrug ABC transporter ATP-binding protein [Streptococcus dysgalactiae subsp. equisimilis]VTT19386.1 ABC transporter ATP-binding protein [Streptococcus dysgalactiae subsp. equisimilis]VTT22085.1 ABC transporter ATP-binding protein [Streptococcus dysgalactiae subsp. equisimilis]
METRLSVVNVKKVYGDREVLSDITLDLEQGEILGLVGPNGAGKTTLMKIILGLTPSSSGQIFVNGEDIVNDKPDYLNQVGSIIEYPGFFPNMTAIDNLEIFTSLYDIKLPKRRYLEVLELVGLSDYLTLTVKYYSLGMKQRLGIAQAIIHYPKLLILDEPFNGLDPIGIENLRELLKKLAQNGVAIMISSHSLEELQKVIHSYIIINNGLSQPKKSLNQDFQQWFLQTENIDRTVAILEALAISYRLIQEDIFELKINLDDDKQMRRQLFKKLSEKDILIHQFSKKSIQLTHEYLSIVKGEE